MTDYEVHDLIYQNLDAYFQSISIFFTITSAYIVALYVFLHRAGLLLKFTGYGLYVAMYGAIFLTIRDVVTMGRYLITLSPQGIVEFREALKHESLLDFVTNASTSAVYSNPEAYGFILYVGYGVGAIIALSLFYLTFLHRWRHKAA